MYGSDLVALLKHAGDQAAALQIGELSERLGVAKGAMLAFLSILGERNVPEPDWGTVLGRIADRYKEMQHRLSELTSDDPDVQALLGRARSLNETGRFDEAETTLLAAQTSALAALDREEVRANQRARDYATTSESLADLQLIKLNYVDAASLMREAARRISPYDPLFEQALLMRFGQIAVELHHYDDANMAFTRVLSLADADPTTELGRRAQVTTWLATTKVRVGEPAEAEILYRDALAYYRSPEGRDPANAARTLNSLANALATQGDREAPIKLIQEAIAVGHRALGRIHPDVAIWANTLGASRMNMARREAARRLFTIAIRIDEQTIGRHHPAALKHLANLATVLMEMGRMEEAMPLLEEAIAHGVRSLGSDNEIVLSRIARYAIFLLDSRQYDRARPLLQDALRSFDLRPRTDRATRSLLENALGRLFVETDQSDLALPLLQSALAGMNAIEPMSSAAAIIAGNCARALAGVGRDLEAVALFQQTVENIDAFGLSEHPRIDRVFTFYALLQEQRGLVEAASALRDRSEGM